MGRIVLHIDMDAFFASIEERERPELKGKPVVVGADPKGGNGRGVVSTASYAARKFGITSGLPISKAWQICPAPACAYLPADGKLYGIVSERIMKVIRETVKTHCHSERSSSGMKNPVLVRTGSFAAAQDDIVIEQVSIDEAYVDVSFCVLYKKAEELARKIKREVLERERLTCSVGIGPNKLIAKIASDFKKPDGLTIVQPEQVQEFLDPMPVRKLPGIGPKTEAQLLRIGIKTVSELHKWCGTPPLTPPQRGGEAKQFPRLSKEGMKGWLGTICAHAQGIDDAPVVEERETKSLSHETTFDKDTRDQALLTQTLMELCAEVLEEVLRERVQFRTITVRVRFDNFETHTSAHSLKKATANDTILKQETLKLLYPYFNKKRLIRLLGVRVSNFMMHAS